MKLHEINFREIYGHVVEIQGLTVVKQLRQMKIDVDGLKGGLFYVYIDHEAGLTFELLAIEVKNKQGMEYKIVPSNMSYKLRAKPVLEEEIHIIQDINVNLFLDKLNYIKEKYMNVDTLEELRSFTDLDSSRHTEYPDDVMVYFLDKSKDPEACWVRVEGFEKRSLYGRLLTKPIQDNGYEVGDRVYFQTMIMEDGSISCICISVPQA